MDYEKEKAKVKKRSPIRISC